MERVRKSYSRSLRRKSQTSIQQPHVKQAAAKLTVLRVGGERRREGGSGEWGGEWGAGGGGGIKLSLHFLVAHITREDSCRERESKEYCRIFYKWNSHRESSCQIKPRSHSTQGSCKVSQIWSLIFLTLIREVSFVKSHSWSLNREVSFVQSHSWSLIREVTFKTTVK